MPQPRPGQTLRTAFAIAMAIAIVLAIAGWLGWRGLERRFYMDRTPLDGGIAGIRHIDKFIAGLGPGGNEIIVVTYRLAPDAIDRLRADRERFIADLVAAESAFSDRGMPPRERRAMRCRTFKRWSSMPIEMSVTDAANPGERETRTVTFAEHIDRYGFAPWFEMPEDRRETIEAVYASATAFHGGSGCGLFIYAPDQGEAYFVFVG